jgi:hypothetical protein
MDCLSNATESNADSFRLLDCLHFEKLLVGFFENVPLVSTTDKEGNNLLSIHSSYA